MDTLAARLREAFLGTETGEAVPFDELKDAVRDRWQRVADAAREVPPEGIALAAARERGHRAAIRVPFSDDQIERMAKAAQPIVYEGTKWHIIDESAKTALRQGIRAALAAGGLEPCAVPEYAAADVALSPSDDEVEALARALHAAWNVKRFGVAPKWEDSTVQDAYRDEARAAIAHMRPTHGHVLRDRLVEAEAKIGRQRVELARLNALVADLRAEVDEDNANAASVNDLLVQVQNLTAERDAQEIELADLRFYQREFAAVSAERDELRERASVPQPSSNTGQLPPADQVEALARVLREAYAKHDGDVPEVYPILGFRIEARAAIAHLATRPEGIPTAEDIKYLPGKPHVFNNELLIAAYKALKTRHALEWDDETNKDGWQRVLDVVRNATYETLRPWLRDPVGFELDVAWQEMQEWLEPDSIGRRSSPHEILDLCRSRIRPVFECKECAGHARRAYDDMARYAAARAALDRLREAVPKVLPPHMSWKDSLDGARAILYPPETTNDDR